MLCRRRCEASATSAGASIRNCFGSMLTPPHVATDRSECWRGNLGAVGQSGRLASLHYNACMQAIRVFVFCSALPCCLAQNYVERNFEGNCDQTEKTARAYLKTRGFTAVECPSCPWNPNSLKSPKALLDARNNMIGTLRIRREFTEVPFWLWSSPLHARVFLRTKAKESGCRLGLWIDFYSLHTMVVGIIPAGERLGLPSNGRLEFIYLEAIHAQIRSDMGSNAPREGRGRSLDPLRREK